MDGVLFGVGVTSLDSYNPDYIVISVNRRKEVIAVFAFHFLMEWEAAADLSTVL